MGFTSFREFIEYTEYLESALPNSQAVNVPLPRNKIRVVASADDAQLGQPGSDLSTADATQQATPAPNPVLRTGEPPQLLGPDYKFKPKKVAQRLAAVPGGRIKDGVFMPKRTLGIPRSEMPQLKSREEFIKWVMEQGVKVQRVQVAPKSLIEANGDKRIGHAQSNIHLDKAMKFIRKNTLLHELIIITRDGVIFDGNHHWLALMAVAPKEPVDMYQVDMDFRDLLQLTKQFPGVTYEEQWVEWLGQFVAGLVFEGQDNELDLAY